MSSRRVTSHNAERIYNAQFYGTVLVAEPTRTKGNNRGSIKQTYTRREREGEREAECLSNSKTRPSTQQPATNVKSVNAQCNRFRWQRQLQCDFIIIISSSSSSSSWFHQIKTRGQQRLQRPASVNDISDVPSVLLCVWTDWQHGRTTRSNKIVFNETKTNLGHAQTHTLYIVYFVISRNHVMTLWIFVLFSSGCCLQRSSPWSTCSILGALTVAFRHLSA